MKIAMSNVVLWVACVLAGCHSAPRTQILDGRFVTAADNRIQIQLDSHGSLDSHLILPLDQQAQVIMGGKQVSIEKLSPTTRIRVVRNLATHRVVRIEVQ